MPINQVLDRAQDHGTVIDKERKKVRCNYCAKVVTNFHRLKYHLAGLRDHVTPCERTPADLRARLRDAVPVNKKQKLVEPSDCPSKTNFILKPAEPPSVCSIVEDSKPTHVFVSKGKGIYSCLNEVRSSWERTGCSILLNGWTNFGRTLLVFLVDCPQGTMFLRSFDASDLVENVDALFSLFDGVVQEVGVENVVQVVTCNNSSIYIEDAGKKLVEKHKSIFWTPCAAHCINLMLEDIGKMDQVRKTLDTAKDITTFTHSHPIAKKLLNIQAQGELVRSVQTRSDVLLTLRNIVSEKERLKNIFSLSAWNTSIWAFTDDGDNVADLVRDTLFWARAEEVLKATNPLVHLLSLIDNDDRPPMGYIYDAIDNAKEKIKKDLGNDKAKYLPVWTIIDAIWNNQLHSPLHSTGYFLNPAIFYSSDFCGDSEVDSGLMCCIDRMVPDLYFQRYLLSQLDEYIEAQGGFASEIAIRERTKSLPDEWWLSNGGNSPQLQRFAVRILSQTCSSKAQVCEPIKWLIEELHAAKRGDEQQRLHDKVFAHANLVLLRSQPAYVREISATSGGDGNHDRDIASDGATSIQIREDSWSESVEEGSDSNL